VLQFDAVFCSVLQCVQCVAVCCGVMQCVAVCCSVLQRDAVCHTVMQSSCPAAVSISGERALSRTCTRSVTRTHFLSKCHCRCLLCFRSCARCLLCFRSCARCRFRSRSHYLHTICTLFAHYLHTIRSHYLHTICSHYLYVYIKGKLHIYIHILVAHIYACFLHTICSHHLHIQRPELLQHTATQRPELLQHTATHCNTHRPELLQEAANLGIQGIHTFVPLWIQCRVYRLRTLLRCVAVCCSVA